MNNKKTNITKQLLTYPERYSFYQTVRLLEAINHEKLAAHPSWQQFPVGYDFSQQYEVVRFTVDPTLRFPAGEVTKIVEPTFVSEKNNLSPAKMAVTFMGLTGPSGILPAHYSERVLKENRQRNYALADFFDLFNHRSISLYYRGWEKYRVQYSFERQRRQRRRNDALTNILSSFTGKLPSKNHRVNPDSFLFYAGLLSNKRRSAKGLEQLLSDYFNVQVNIQQFIGSWNPLKDSECTRTPSKVQPQGQYNALGKNTLLSKRVWYSQGKFRIKLGPLSPIQFKRFLPGSTGLKQLKTLVNQYITPELSFDVQLISEPQKVPDCQLSERTPPQLGYFTWLKGKSTKIQHDQLILT